MFVMTLNDFVRQFFLTNANLVILFFFLVYDRVQNKLECLSLTYFQISLIFVSFSLPMWRTLQCNYLWVANLVLLNELVVTLQGQNALAYFDHPSVRKMKGFTRLTAINQIQVHSKIAANEKNARGADSIKLFISANDAKQQ